MMRMLHWCWRLWVGRSVVKAHRQLIRAMHDHKSAMGKLPAAPEVQKGHGVLMVKDDQAGDWFKYHTAKLELDKAADRLEGTQTKYHVAKRRLQDVKDAGASRWWMVAPIADGACVGGLLYLWITYPTLLPSIAHWIQAKWDVAVQLFGMAKLLMAAG